jgi:hypothetical protein
MPRARLYICLGMGRKKSLLRDTLDTTAKQSKIRLVNSLLADYPTYGEEIKNFGWPTLHKWGYRCVPITVSYNLRQAH